MGSSISPTNERICWDHSALSIDQYRRRNYFTPGKGVEAAIFAELGKMVAQWRTGAVVSRRSHDLQTASKLTRSLDILGQDRVDRVCAGLGGQRNETACATHVVAERAKPRPSVVAHLA